MLLVLGCVAPSESPTGRVHLDLSTFYGQSPLVESRVDSITIAVTAADLATPIMLKADVKDGGVVTDIPAGPKRYFEVRAERTDLAQPQATYWGELETDLPAGTDIDLTFKAYAAGTVAGILSAADEQALPGDATLTATAIAPRPRVRGVFNIAVHAGAFSATLPTGAYKLAGSVKRGNVTMALDDALQINIAQGEITLVALTLTSPSTDTPTRRLAFIDATDAAGPVVAGQTLPTTVVQITDSAGNPLPVADVAINLTLAPAEGTFDHDVSLDGTTTHTTTFGAVTFEGLRVNTAGIYRWVASGSGLTSVTGAPFTVVAAAPAGVRVAIGQGPFFSGTPCEVTLTSIDAFGNTAPDYTGSVALSSTDPNIVWPDTVLFTAADGGEKTIVFTPVRGGEQTITATDTVADWVGTATIPVQAGAATRLSLTGLASAVSTGPLPSLQVIAYDAAGNRAVGYAGTLTLTSTDANALLPAPHPMTGADAGFHEFTGGILTAIGAQSITVSDGNLTASAFTTVSPGAASHVGIGGPTAIAAGTPFQVLVTPLDAFGNPTSNCPGSLAFSSDDPHAILPNPATITLGDALPITVTATLTTAGSRRISVTDAVLAAPLATSEAIFVQPLVAQDIRFDLPSDTVAGVAFTASVSFVDMYGNVAPDYIGEVSITDEMDPGATLPGPTTFDADDAGFHAFSITLARATEHTLTARETGDPGRSATGTTLVSPGAAAKLKVETVKRGLPTGLQACVVLDPAPAVTVRDSSDNLVTDSNAPISVTLATNPHGLQLGGTLTVAATTGRATFDDLTLSAADSAVTLTFVSPTLVGVSAAPMVITEPVPKVTELTADAAVNGLVTLHYTVAHACAAKVDITVRYDALGGSVPTQRATQGPALAQTVGVHDVPTHATGQAQAFVWNAWRDLGEGLTPNVTLEVVAKVGTSAEGPGGQTNMLVDTRPTVSETPKLSGNLAWEAVAAGDLNEDGQLDLVGINGPLHMLSVALGSATGLSQESASPISTVFAVRGVVLADLNGDSHLDLVMWDPNQVLLQPGDGTGGFDAVTALARADVAGVAVGDMDHDGLVDLVATLGNNGDPNNADPNNVVMARGSEPGLFDAFVSVAQSGGTGAHDVALLDIDHDGYLDIAVANSNTVATLRNNGMSVSVSSAVASFSPATLYTVDAQGALTTADVNADGTADIVVVSPVANTLTTLLSQDGNYIVQAAISTGTQPRAVACADVNADGRPDALVATGGNNAGDNTVALFLGAANGAGFATTQTLATGTDPGPLGIVVTDLNHDGRPDFYVPSSVSSSVQTFLTDTPRRLHEAIWAANAYSAGPGSQAVAVGDLNNDGRPDAAVADPNGSVTLLLGAGDGQLRAGATITTAVGAQGLALADVNNDGNTDLLLPVSSGVVEIYLGDGTGSVAAVPSHVDAGQGYSRLVTGDFNDDHRVDFAVLNRGSITLTLYQGDGSGSFTPRSSIAIPPGPSDLVVTDFDNDAHQDIAIVSDGNTMAVYRGGGDGTFTPLGKTFATGGDARAIAAGVLIAGGSVDLLSANYGPSSVSIGRNDGEINLPVTGTPQDLVLDSTIKPTAIATGSFNGDLSTDVVVTNSGLGGIGWLAGSALGPSAPATLSTGGRNPMALALTDFNGDAKTDVITANSASNDSVVHLQSRHGGFVGATLLDANNAAGLQSVALADLNHDGRLDLIVVAQQSNALLVYLAAATQPPYSLPTTYTVGAAPMGLTVADFNRDGSLDLATGSSDATNLSVLLNQGDGTFGLTNLRTAGTGAVTAVAAADVDGNGSLDLLAVIPSRNEVSILLGTSTPGTPIAVGNTPTALAVADLNRDGKLDVVTADSGAGVTVAMGDGGGSFVATPITAGIGSSPTCVAVGDMNHDGRLDIVIGAHGSNTVTVLLNMDGIMVPQAPVHLPGAAGPVAMALADINGDGRLDMVIAMSEDGYVAVAFGNGNGGATEVTRFAGQPGMTGVAVGDINRDGVPDIAVTGPRPALFVSGWPLQE